MEATRYPVVEPKYDERDYNIAQFVPGKDIIPDQEFCLNLPELQIVINQANVSSCVAHSLSSCKSIVEYNGTKKWIDFSPSWLYADREPFDHQGMGMRASEAIQVLKKRGTVLRRDFNVLKEVPELYVDFKLAREANPKLVTEALDFTINGYSKLTTPEEVKRSLKAGMPVTASWRIFNSFERIKSDGLVPVPGEREIQLGNHQMTIIGWRKDNRYIVLNSWGAELAHAGLYYIPWEGYSPYEMYSISDTIFPAKPKAETITMRIGDKFIRVNGKLQLIDVAAMELNGRSYLPVRVISEALGASVEWDDPNQRVTLRSEEATIIMEIGSSVIYVNGRPVNIDVAPILYQDRTLLPIRFVAEYFNCIVDWDDRTSMVTIIAR